MILIFTLFGAICIHSAATAAFLQDPMFSARHLERRILVDEPIARTRKLASTDFLSAATTTRRDWIEQAASTFVGLATSIAVESSTPSSTTLCDPAVSSWVNQRQGRVIHVVGTAHISSVSADLAANVVKEIKVSSGWVRSSVALARY